MFLTEEEAKKKSCCGPMQADYGQTHVVNCIASACMAWRSEIRGRLAGKSDWGGGSVIETLKLGFCGLAGRPVEPVR